MENNNLEDLENDKMIQLLIDGNISMSDGCQLISRVVKNLNERIKVLEENAK